MKPVVTSALFACLTLAGAAHTVRAAKPPDPVNVSARMSCEGLQAAELAGIPDAPTTVTEVHAVGPTSAVPTYCEVAGYVAPSVGFKVKLPAQWNGKFVHIGCGNYCGDTTPFEPSCDEPLRRGYACLVSDMGHRGSGADVLWSYHNLQAKVDWGYRATHVATLAGKAIIERYYAGNLKKSYFMGCSTGGRQALQEAQKFPYDFDGIVAGAPPTNLAMTYMSLIWGVRAARDSAGKPLLGEAELSLLSRAAVEKCDLDDGVKDGIIGDPMHCRFDPGALACKPGKKDGCLTQAQIDAARKIYAGPSTTSGLKLSFGGPMPGSEYWKPPTGFQSDWTLVYTGIDGEQPLIHDAITNGMRYLLLSPEPGPSWKLSDFDFDRDYMRFGSAQALDDATNPDLRQFKAAGGKLIAFQGLNDSLVIPRLAIEYYETAERAMGGRAPTQEFFRLFLLPGVNHCSGGAGADAADFLGSLEAWAERGQAPDEILTGHVADGSLSAYPYRQFPTNASDLTFTRPVYPYPIRARYKGSGDPSDAANFVAVHR